MSDDLLAKEIAVRELQLADSGRRPVYFHGLTMMPLLYEGDEVETEPVTGDEVRVGDVVTYRFEDKFPTRRVIVVDREARQLVIMGDSIPAGREYIVDFDDVLARVTRRRRDGEWLTATHWRWRFQTLRILARDRRRRDPRLAPLRRTWRAARHRLGV